MFKLGNYIRHNSKCRKCPIEGSDFCQDECKERCSDCNCYGTFWIWKKSGKQVCNSCLEKISRKDWSGEGGKGSVPYIENDDYISGSLALQDFKMDEWKWL